MEPTGTILKIIDAYGLVGGMAIMLIIFMSLNIIYLNKNSTKKDTQFSDYVDKKDSESLQVNKEHSEEIRKMLDDHDEIQIKYIEENSEDRKSFISSLHEISEAISGIKLLNEHKFNAIEKDLGEIKNIVNSK